MGGAFYLRLARKVYFRFSFSSRLLASSPPLLASLALTLLRTIFFIFPPLSRRLESLFGSLTANLGSCYERKIDFELESFNNSSSLRSLASYRNLSCWDLDIIISALELVDFCVDSDFWSKSWCSLESLFWCSLEALFYWEDTNMADNSSGFFKSS